MCTCELRYSILQSSPFLMHRKVTRFIIYNIFFRSDLTIDPLKYVDLPENLQERDKYYLYSEMILQLQMARDHLLRQQSEKSVSLMALMWPFKVSSRWLQILCCCRFSSTKHTLINLAQSAQKFVCFVVRRAPLPPSFTSHTPRHSIINSIILGKQRDL